MSGATTCTGTEKPTVEVSETNVGKAVNEMSKEQSAKLSLVRRYVPPSSSSPTNVYRLPTFRPGTAGKNGEDLTETSVSVSAPAVHNGKSNTLGESSEKIKDSQSDATRNAETSVIV